MTLLNRLTSWIEDKNRREAEERKPLGENEFYASSTGACSRCLYYEKTLGYREPGPSTQKVFVLGQVVHEFVQKNLLTEGESESRVFIEIDGIVIRGRLDHIDDDHIWELKSTSSLRYITEPYESHLMQLMIYLKGRNRNKGKIAYIEKNTFDIKEFDVEYDEEIYNKAVSKFKEVINAVKMKRPCKRLRDFPNGKFCLGCAYLPECSNPDE
jgi:CRISPR/Cas system-associated exonuclease Cas4 (RecB family)